MAIEAPPMQHRPYFRHSDISPPEFADASEGCVGALPGDDSPQREDDHMARPCRRRVPTASSDARPARMRMPARRGRSPYFLVLAMLMPEGVAGWGGPFNVSRSVRRGFSRLYWLTRRGTATASVAGACSRARQYSWPLLLLSADGSDDGVRAASSSPQAPCSSNDPACQGSPAPPTAPGTRASPPCAPCSAPAA